MSTPSEPYSTRDRDRAVGAESSGWIAFAAIILFINGCFAAFWGLGAIFNDEVVTVGGGEGVVIWDITGWGWITLIIAILMIITAIGLFTGNRGARWLAVLFATLSALAQFAIVTAFPLWAILVIVLDVVVIYQLVARWEQPATHVR